MEAISNGLKANVSTSCCSEVFCQFSSTCFGVSRHLLNKIPRISCRQHYGSARSLIIFDRIRCVKFFNYALAVANDKLRRVPILL
jgi:hypothetical protein